MTSVGSITTRFFFRGVPNVSYKIYSSMQRCYFERNKNGQTIFLCMNLQVNEKEI